MASGALALAHSERNAKPLETSILGHISSWRFPLHLVPRTLSSPRKLLRDRTPGGLLSPHHPPSCQVLNSGAERCLSASGGWTGILSVPMVIKIPRINCRWEELISGDLARRTVGTRLQDIPGMKSLPARLHLLQVGLCLAWRPPHGSSWQWQRVDQSMFIAWMLLFS